MLVMVEEHMGPARSVLAVVACIAVNLVLSACSSHRGQAPAVRKGDS
jgi:hypothetical protein